MTQVKICGLSEPNTVTAAIESGSDFIGFVFYEASPRHVDIEIAKYLTSFIPDNVQKVGLFVDPDDQYLTNVLNDVPLSMIQLHGDETPERITEIKEKFGLPVMKALPISSKDDLEEAISYDGIADWLLFDARPQVILQAIGPGKKLLPGGNGAPFDWNILKDYQGTTPWMLAGGLTPENVTEALTLLSPMAVDVSSGVETDRGIKDADKIRSFLNAVKQA